MGVPDPAWLWQNWPPDAMREFCLIKKLIKKCKSRRDISKNNEWTSISWQVWSGDREERICQPKARVGRDLRVGEWSSISGNSNYHQDSH